MKIHSKNLALVVLVLALTASAHAQVNSGSTGADGAFNPTANTVINMADHPDGIYHYASVNIPTNVTVTFIPNGNNTPVVWLVQTTCVISGIVNLAGQAGANHIGGIGGPGGFRGGNSGNNHTGGQGPGGGSSDGDYAGNASHATYGKTNATPLPGALYGNTFTIPLVGGSGGGGSAVESSGLHGLLPGGGGGGGAILIAASSEVALNGSIESQGGPGDWFVNWYGAGSGGAVRIVSARITGSGTINVEGGFARSGAPQPGGGSGRIRLDVLENGFGGTIRGVFTQGFQPIIIPSTGQGTQLSIASVAGAPVAASPNGLLATPDSIIAAQSSNPVAIVVRCTNLPLNTPVTVTVKPANGAAISAVGYNTSGTLASSTATVQLNMPRGGGLIYATAATAP